MDEEELASYADMLDAISNGRVEIGFSRAWIPDEFDAFGIDMDGSRERFTETIHAIRKLWTESNVSITSEYFSFDNVNIFPPTIQQPHIPVWIAAVQSRQSFAWIGQEGFKLLLTPGLQTYDSLKEFIDVYRENFAYYHPHLQSEVAISLPIYLHTDEKQAIREGDYYLKRYLDVWADAAKTWNSRTSSDYPRYTGFGLGLRIDSPEQMRDRGAAIVGTPSQALEQMHELHVRLGAETILWQIDSGAMPGDKAERCLNLFLEYMWSGCIKL